jgi:hypothetical protein
LPVSIIVNVIGAILPSSGMVCGIIVVAITAAVRTNGRSADRHHVPVTIPIAVVVAAFVD